MKTMRGGFFSVPGEQRKAGGTTARSRRRGETRRTPPAGPRRTALACEQLERRRVLAVTWPATAPPLELGDAQQIYVNQFGDAWIHDAVIGPGGRRLSGVVFWDDQGPATIQTTGPLQTEMAWYGPSGRLTDAGPGSASIARDVDAWDRHVVSIAGRDDGAVGQVGVEIDGPDYQGIGIIEAGGGYGVAEGGIGYEYDYVFYKFTAAWDGIWSVGVEDLGCDPTMVIFDGFGNPIGGSFLTAMAGEPGLGWGVTWSGRLSAGDEVFVRIDGSAAATGRFRAWVDGFSAEVTVTNTFDSGYGSLRWAIEQANASIEPTTIWFDPFPGGTLQLRSPLPPIERDTTLRFAPGVSSFTIDAARIPEGSGPIMEVSGWEWDGARTFARFDTSAAPLTLVNFPDIGLALPDDLFNSSIAGLTLAGRGSPGSVGIRMGSMDGARFPGTALYGNQISGVDYGIVVDIGCFELQIHSNSISGCREAGIIVVGPVHGTWIAGNTLTGNGTGLAAWEAQGLTIGSEGFENNFVSNVQSGVYLSGDSSRTGVFGNTFVHNNVGVTFDGARNALVGGTPASQGNTITAGGDTAFGQYRAGIYGLGELAGSIALNTTVTTGFLGVNLAQARGLTVANTTVRNHHGLGLVAQGQGVGMAGTVVSGLRVERTGGQPPIDTAGAVLIDATDMRLEASNFSGDTTGIFVFNEAAGLVIVGNTFTGRATGVGLFQARNLAFGQIGLGNTIQNAPGAGIYTGGNLAGTSIVANTITNNAVGIVLDNTTNLAVGGPTDRHGNAITGTGNSTGIWARLACSGTSIRKTRFSGHAADATLSASTGIDFQP